MNFGVRGFMGENIFKLGSKTFGAKYMDIICDLPIRKGVN
jgi:hypothetical protein